MNRLSLLSLSIILLALSGCSDSDFEFADMKVEKIYNLAIDELREGNNKTAARIFEEVERQHPYSNWAVKAQYMGGFAHYLAKDYDEAIENFKLFIDLHPHHEKVAYCLYMIGMCYYEQIPIIERDQDASIKALSAFKDLATRYPRSKYTKDALFKSDFVINHIAAHEMDIGRNYQRRGLLIAAIKRYNYVLKEYKDTDHTPEVLHRLVECYLAQGLVDQAKAHAAVLGHNYSDSIWYQRSFDLLKGLKK